MTPARLLSKTPGSSMRRKYKSNALKGTYIIMNWDYSVGTGFIDEKSASDPPPPRWDRAACQTFTE